MNPCVKQMRDSFHDGIKRNETKVSFIAGGLIIKESVRLAHESASVPANRTTPVGLGTSFSMFLEAEYFSQIKEGDILIENGNGWKVGAVDTLRVEEKVYGKRAPLTSATLSSSKTITSFKIGSVSGTVTGTNVAITLPHGTDITALTPEINHTGKIISPVTAQDFTTPKTYTITAQDLTTQEYNIIVGVAQ